MEKIYVFLADGFEEIEGLTVVDVMRRAKLDVDMVAVCGKREVTGSHGIVVQADLLFEEIHPQDCVMYVLPGGGVGTQNLAAHAGLASLLKNEASNGKRIAAICAAPSVLGGLGLLEGHTAVCYPGFEEKLAGAQVTTHSVEVSGSITTSRGMGTSLPFALALVAQLKGEEEAERVAGSVLWRI